MQKLDVYTYDPRYKLTEKDLWSEDEFKEDAQIWFKNGLIHRDGDEPALIQEDGGRRWYKEGVLHRDNDLPAIVTTDSQEWWVNGMWHRDNGEPAIVSPNFKAWYVNGKRHRENDLPAEDGLFKFWYKNGVRHRDATDPQIGLLLPASIWSPDETRWYLNGVRVDEHGKPI
jgi:hypothetical protein